MEQGGDTGTVRDLDEHTEQATHLKVPHPSTVVADFQHVAERAEALHFQWQPLVQDVDKFLLDTLRVMMQSFVPEEVQSRAGLYDCMRGEGRGEGGGQFGGIKWKGIILLRIEPVKEDPLLLIRSHEAFQPAYRHIEGHHWIALSVHCSLQSKKGHGGQTGLMCEYVHKCCDGLCVA